MTTLRPRPIVPLLAGLALAGALAACGERAELERIGLDEAEQAARRSAGPVELIGDGAAGGVAPDAEEGRRAVELDPEDRDLEPAALAADLVVRVLSTDGQPVPAAEVWLFEPRAGEYERTLDAMGAAVAAEAFLVEHGAQERTDAEGVVRVASFERRGLVGARVGAAWGSAVVQAEQTEVVVRLQPDERLLVRVVDPQGDPRAGVPVGLSEVRRNRVRRTRTVETDEDGIAELLNPRDFFALGRRDSSWFVSPVVPLAEPPTEPIEPDALPEEPIELVLPATASLRVEVVEQDGEPFSGRGVLSARASRARWYVPFEVHLDGESTAVVPFLEPGLPIRLEFEREGSRADYDLDTQAPPVADFQGEERFVLAPTHPVLVARLTDETGEPLAERRVEYRVREAVGQDDDDRRRRWDDDRDTGSRAVTTDARGYLRVDLPDRWVRETNTAFEGEVRTVVEGLEAVERSATFDVPSPLVDGPNDAGWLVLAPPPLLAAGRVLDETGLPVEDAQVTIHLETFDDEGEGSWNYVDGLTTRTDETGAFRVVDWPPGATLGIRASSRDHVRAEIVRFAAGDGDLVLRLVGAGRVAGSVRVPDGVDERRVTVRAVAGAPRLDDAEALADATAARATPRRGDGRFELTRITPGAYTVVVTYAGLPGVLFARRGVLVEAGTTARPDALDPIDLTGVLRAFELRLLEPSGDPVRWANVRWRPAGGERWTGARVGRDGRLTIVADAAIIDVHAITRGVAPTLFEGVSTSRDLTLLEPLDVTVRVDPDQLPQDEGFSLSVQLVPLEWGGARTTARLDDQGRGRFASAGPGPHAIHFRLAREGRRGGVTFTSQPPEEVDLDAFAEEVVLRPRVPRGRLEAALERLR